MSSGCVGSVRRRLRGWLLLSFGVSLLAPLRAQPPTASKEHLAEVLRAWMDEFGGVRGLGSGEELPDFRPGLLEQFQLRSESDRLDLGRQRYAIRFQPKLPHVRNAERRLQEAERLALGDLALPAARDADELALRHLFRLASDAAELHVIDSLLTLQQTLVEVTFRRMAEPRYDVERVLDAQDDLSDLRLRREQLERRAARRPAPLPLDLLVDVRDLTAKLAALSAGGLQALPTSPRLAILDAELALEKAENQTWLDFLQVNYRSDLDETRERYSIGGGIELPRRTSSLTAVDKIQVERRQEEIEQRIDQRVREQEFGLALGALSLKLAQYDELAGAVAERRRNRAPLEELLASSAEAQPEDVLRLRRRNLGDQLTLLDLASEILEDYAALLTEHFLLDAAMLTTYVLEE